MMMLVEQCCAIVVVVDDDVVDVDTAVTAVLDYGNRHPARTTPRIQCAEVLRKIMKKGRQHS